MKKKNISKVVFEFDGKDKYIDVETTDPIRIIYNGQIYVKQK